MLRTLFLCLALLAGSGCHGFFGGRTTEEDQELNNFAEARQRAATYYDGGDYERAATQYGKALEYRPEHVPTQLGFAYSLMFTEKPRNLARAENEFHAMGKLDERHLEIKRIYGLAMTHRTLAKIFTRREIVYDQRGLIPQRNQSRDMAHKHAREGLALFQSILDIDVALSKEQKVAPFRVSASLTPDAHVGMAHCEIILADAKPTKHLDRAAAHIRSFSKTAEKARRFWTERRERILATDPLREDELGRADQESVRGQQRQLYAKRILATISQEVAMRRALIEVYIQLQRYDDAIEECDIILALDSKFDRVYWIRGQAYAAKKPPNYRAAIKDLEEYHSRIAGPLTEELIRVNNWLRKYRALVKGAPKKG